MEKQTIERHSLTRVEAESANLIGPNTNAIYDYEFTLLLKNIPWAEWMTTTNALRCRPEFLHTFREWIASSRLNRIEGLKRFTQMDLINGTTQTFDEAYYKYAGRRLRFFRGEYAYHRRVGLKWEFIGDSPLAPGDFIIVSAPFCSDGRVPAGLDKILDEAHTLEVPVIVDCAYFGTCEGLELDVTHPAIESVSFSLTKGLGLGDIRSGIRFSNLEDQNPIRQQNIYDHTVLAAARIGLYMMERLGPDFIPLKYSEIQKQVCAELGLLPTPCMHLALGPGGVWENYRVDDKFQRVGIRNLVRARFKGEI